MVKLLDINTTNKFLSDFSKENDISVAFLANLEGGLICASDLSARIVVETLSTFWNTLLPPQWKRISFEWETSYIILINCDGLVLGLQQNDPNHLTLGMLRLKANKFATYIKEKLEGSANSGGA